MRTVTFHAPEIRLSVTVKMTGPATLINHHHEGWQQVARLMKYSFPEWQGAPGWEIQIPVIFDGFPHNESKNNEIHKLERMSYPMPTKIVSPMRPPVLTFTSGGDIPHDKHNAPLKKWIIAGTGLAWGDYITDKPDPVVAERAGGRGKDVLSFLGLEQASAGGPEAIKSSKQLSQAQSHFRRVRQQLTVYLWEWFGDEILVADLNDATYVIKKGDTLEKIALTFYGTKKAWRKIAKVNKLRDPNHPKVGKTIQLP